MRAIVLDKDRVTARSDYPEPGIRTGEVLVKVLSAGVCETDLQLVRGYMGFQGVLGHEFVGMAQTGPLILATSRGGSHTRFAVHRSAMMTCT